MIDDNDVPYLEDGRSPFGGPWGELHSSIARRAERFIGPVEAPDRMEFDRLLDEFLTTRARKLKCTRLGTTLSRWVTRGEGSSKLLSDVDLFATSFVDGPEWEELRMLMREIRPNIPTSRGRKRAASNEPLAFTFLLMLLADRAGRSYDAQAIEKADAILSDLAGTLSILAWRGAHAFESSSDGGRKGSASKLSSDEELRRLATHVLTEGIAPHNLAQTIVDRAGGRFGVCDHVRRRLQLLGIIPKRQSQKPT